MGDDWMKSIPHAEPRDTLDRQLLDELCAVTPGGFKELIRFFVTITPSKIAAIREAAAAGDAEGLRRTAHSLAGSSGTIGALRLWKLCHEIEQLAIKGRIATAQPLVTRLDPEFADVHGALEREIAERLQPSDAG